jgi:hypothetical protein
VTWSPTGKALRADRRRDPFRNLDSCSPNWLSQVLIFLLISLLSGREKLASRSRTISQLKKAHHELNTFHFPKSCASEKLLPAKQRSAAETETCSDVSLKIGCHYPLKTDPNQQMNPKLNRTILALRFPRMIRPARPSRARRSEQTSCARSTRTCVLAFISVWGCST